MDESSPEYQKAKKKMNEIESSIRHYRVKLGTSLYDLDHGLPEKTNVERYTNKLNDLKHELSELEYQIPPRKYTTAEVDEIKFALMREEGRMYSMKRDEEILGVSCYTNQISFEQYRINELKEKLKKAKTPLERD